MTLYYPQQQDYCPVCRSARPLTGEVYCSKGCRVSAYNYRKRLANELKFLTELGFVSHFTNGVLLEINLPVSIASFYPEHIHMIMFPAVDRLLDSINAQDLWMVLDEYLGPMVADFTRWLFMRGQYHDRLAVDLFLQFVRSVVEQRSFRCPTCHQTFIDSEGGRSQTGSSQCVDCAISQGQPF
jgi:predicted nucleic acid-binding Zn ribbon protein